MNKKEYQFSFAAYTSSDALSEANKEDASLLDEARKITELAYAPYSHFHVGAVAKLANGKTISGTNQENASYPVGICAERALLAAVGTLYPNVPIETMAISYHNHNENGTSDNPVSPCGMCRQALVEYENRTGETMRLILSGMKGEVFVIDKASQLLPLSFGKDDLKG